MKTYEQLTQDEQEKARAIALTELLEAIVSGVVRFNDGLNEDNLQARIDGAGVKADKMQTPWFVHEYIMDTCKDDLESMALCDAEDALYPESGERIINL